VRKIAGKYPTTSDLVLDAVASPLGLTVSEVGLIRLISSRLAVLTAARVLVALTELKL